MKILFNVSCICGHDFETMKTENIQCRECGRRFNLAHPNYIPPSCPICHGIIFSISGTTKIICKECAREWNLV